MREGYVSRDAAHRDYGVLVTGDGKLDASATKLLRARLAAGNDIGDAFEVIAG